MLRTLKRWFSTEEVKALSDDYEKLRDKFEDMGHKLEGFGLRLDRLSNRYRMQDVRSKRASDTVTELSDEELEMLENLRRNGAPQHDPFGH